MRRQIKHPMPHETDFQEIPSTDVFERIPYVANKKRGVDSYHLRFETYHSLSL